MEKRDIKIFVIHNTAPFYRAVDILYSNPRYKNHLEYWREHLSRVNYQNVSEDDLYSDTRNLIALKITMEDNIVFMDTSNNNSNYKSGILFLPSNVSPVRKKMAALLTSSYDYLNIVYNIFYDGYSYHAKERDVVRPSEKINILTYHI